MSEPDAYDLWLLRVDGHDKARLAAIGSLLRVDVRAAKHIVSNLPRLLARDLQPGPARKVVAQLKNLGGVAQLCPAGQAPRFDPETKAAPAAHKAESRKGARANDALVEAARAAQDAAMAHWPAQAGPYAWEREGEARPPPVPAPVRHSAGRVALLLSLSLLGVGGGAAAYWAQFGDEVVGVTIAEPAVAPALAAAQPASEQEALARSFAELARGEGFRALVAILEKKLGSQGPVLRVADQDVGVTFHVLANQVPFKLEEYSGTARTAGATLFVSEHEAWVGMDRVALVPTPDSFVLLRLFETSGPGLGAAQIETWLRALHAKQALRITGVGPRFVEGRFEVPSLDQEALASALYDCPGTTRAQASATVGGADSVTALAGKQRGELFACKWPEH
jgi:hypothetical protein